MRSRHTFFLALPSRRRRNNRKENIMQKKHLLLVVLVLAASACAKDANSVLNSAQSAMGNPKSIQYSGTGMNAFFGQALSAGKEWPRRDLTSYTRTINYDAKSSREEMSFAQQVFGGQQQNAEVNGNKAWNVGANGPNPQPAAAEERQLQIWLTPHGFLKGALAAGNAGMRDGDSGSHLLTFKALGKYDVTGTIDSNNMVTKVETIEANPVLGDMPVVATYSDYKDFTASRFQTRIVQP